MAKSLNESTVEEAALSWFGELGYAVACGPDIAPGEPVAIAPTVTLLRRGRDSLV